MSTPRLLNSRAAVVGPLSSAPALSRVRPAGAVPRRPGGSWLLLLLAGVLLCWSGLFPASASAKTAMQTYVEALQPGWNLGNTLDATPNETAWGNPPVTQEYIQHVAAQGFKSIRIPVTWDTGGRVGPAPDYAIDPAWLARVQQVVDWSLGAGLYVMINMHHDSYWVKGMPTNHDAVLAKFNAIWSQVAPRFRDYPGTLMFESINEPTFDGVDGATKAALLKELNLSFYNIVRGTGGGNATRPLVLPSVETNSAQSYLDSLNETIAPLNDPNLIATIHFYGFWPFSVNIAGGIRFDDAVKNDITSSVDNVYNTFVSKGVPVIMGEFGLLSSFNSDGSGHVERGEALKYFEFLTSYAHSKGVTYQLWDAGNFFSRYTFQWNDPELYSYIMQSLAGRSSTAETDLVFLRDGTPLQDAVIQLNLNGNSFVSLNNGATPLTLGSDYLINGDVLTIKASALAAYATGAFGEKAVLTANFTGGGPGWKLRLRHVAASVLSTASSTKTAPGGLVIPAAFNGDLVANMEARYVASPNYPYPGPASWTAFQGFGDVYQPDYANNTLTLQKSFFDNATNDAIELTFHMWSGQDLNYRLTLQPGGGIISNPQEWSIYSDGLTGWNTWGSWAGNNPDNTTVVHSGTKSISVDAGAWGGFVLAHNPWEPPVDTSSYRTLVFWINGGTGGGQKLGVGIEWGFPFVEIPAPQANTWTKVEILLSDLGAAGKADISKVILQNWRGDTAPTYYIDDISLTTAYPSNIVFVTGSSAPVITSSTIAGGMFNTPFSYTMTAINNPASFSATGLPPGLVIDSNTGVISGTPTAAGLYDVSIGATNAAGTGSSLLTILINPEPVTFSLKGGSFSVPVVAAYTGVAQPISVTSSPAGIPVTITYNGANTPPLLPGTYNVVVTSADPNYAGTVQGTVVITVAALVNHAPTINGDLEGSLQLLNGESFAVNSSGAIAGDLLLPGTAQVQLHGKPMFAGIIEASGAVMPNDYTLTLNSGAVLRYVVRRVDPLAMPVVAPARQPAGLRDVALNNANQSPGSFATIRNLTLNGNVGPVAVPAGVYGNVIVNGNSSLVLGVAGATTPSVYEFQGLTLDGKSSLGVVGPVTLKLANGTSFNGLVGSADHPEWLQLEIVDGNLTLNGNAVVHALVTAPKGSVTINGTLHGRVSADSLIINGHGLLQDSSL